VNLVFEALFDSDPGALLRVKLMQLTIHERLLFLEISKSHSHLLVVLPQSLHRYLILLDHLLLLSHSTALVT
jgi:hypothetical protein